MHKFRFLKSNKGSSLILVAALTVVIIGLTVSLRILAGIIMASANQQLNQDQAYELATSLGNALEERILNGENADEVEEGGEPKKTFLDLKSILGEQDSIQLMEKMTGFDNLPKSSVEAVLTKNNENQYIVTVKSIVGEASYIWTGIYRIKDEGYEKCPE